MKYLCLAYYDTEKFDALSPAELQNLVSQCPARDKALQATGALMLSASLGDTKETRRIRPKNGWPAVTDGPFVETREQVGGFFIIEAESMEGALRIASEHPAATLGESVGWGIEVRPIDFFELSA